MHICAYIQPVGFEWDQDKARVNLRKHGVDFADAATIFDDPLAVTVSDEAAAEPRFVTMGSDAEGRVLVVGYAWPGHRIRIYFRPQGDSPGAAAIRGLTDAQGIRFQPGAARAGRQGSPGAHEL